MGERKAEIIDGVAYILPASEGGHLFVKRVGPVGIGMMWRWSSFGIGADILKAGVLIAIGPLFLFVAHIEKQLAEPPLALGEKQA